MPAELFGFVKIVINPLINGVEGGQHDVTAERKVYQ